MTRLARGCLLAVLVHGAGCARLPPGRQAVDRVEIEGTRKVDDDDIEEKIATAPSPKFLGLFRGVLYDYELYDPGKLERDLERIQRYYQARGYYDVQVRAGRVRELPNRHVEVSIDVDEGEPVRVGEIYLEGLDELDEATATAARKAMTLKVGDLFDEQRYQETQEALTRALSDRGHAYARSRRRAQIDLPNHRAAVRYRVRPGPRVTYGPVTVEGLGPLPEEPVRLALGLKVGDPFSTIELEESRAAVLNLGAFAAVDIEPQLADEPSDAPVPLKVKVQPSSLRGVQLGVGAEVDVIRTDIHALVGWEHRNFLGGFRHLTVTGRPGLVFYPTRLPTFQAPTAYLPEARVQGELVQPGLFEKRTRGTLRSQFNVFPVLLSPKVDPNASVIGYREVRASVGLDRNFWQTIFGDISANVQRNDPFSYVGPLDPALSGITIFYLDLLTQYDRRDSKIHPHKGFFLGNDLQIAPGLGDARDVRVQPEARVFIPLAKRVTVAMRGSVGFLFPSNYATTLRSNAASGKPPDGVDRARWVEDVQLVYLRAFFSGGPNSNRGYALRGVGPHGVVPFFNPDLAALALSQGCDPGGSEAGSARCEQPLGGLSLWEASAELRFPVLGALSGATFCDTSDASPQQVKLRFDYLHLSCGLGLRYDTPVGPIRADVGVRVPGMQILGKPDDAVEGNPGTILGLPLAISLGIGESF